MRSEKRVDGLSGCLCVWPEKGGEEKRAKTKRGESMVRNGKVG